MRMKRLKVVMLGAGSGFTVSVVNTLGHAVLRDCEFRLVDTDPQRLRAAQVTVRDLIRERKLGVKLVATTDVEKALEGCDYVIASCEINRIANWIKDIEIPERHGVYQLTGENGGPGGLIHGMRNIGLFMPIIQAMERVCPNAWLLNFTNPESILLTYFLKHTRIKSAGFCHQVHGVMGVIAEMLGFPPGELQVISVGVNHLNWLMDIRRRNTGRSYLKEFEKRIQKSIYWTENHPEKILPEQNFSLEVWKTFGTYPIGYDGHVVEYLSFFYEQKEWATKQFPHSHKEGLIEQLKSSSTAMDHALKMQTLMGKQVAGKPPFPRNHVHPYYREAPGEVMVSLETNKPLYLDACVGFNHGAASNLPYDAIVDRPVLVVGGDIRSLHVGELPMGPAEICRRQIALHDLIAKAAVEGDASLAVQALCLDPYVRSITQARAIWADYYREYKDLLPMFAKPKVRARRK
jgi:alpha-galactosidase